ncbi:MAG: DNRLRE domain-containing protein [Nitrospira sp.]|nr:DNRLRE domain-containing protein [Nitrospira sp.]
MEVDITPDHDSFVFEGSSETNYGSETYLACKQWFDNRRMSFVKWSLSLIQSNIPSGAEIISATFYLYISLAVGALSAIPIYQVSSDWNESTITWNNKPGVTGNSLGNISWASTGWKTLNITTLFTKWYEGTANAYGIRIHSGLTPYSSENIANAYSSENASNKPYVKVEYNLIPHVITPQPSNIEVTSCRLRGRVVL